MTITPRPAWERYAVAVGCVAIGWLARSVLSYAVGPSGVPFITFFAAVAIAAWFGGASAGVLATALSAVTAHYFYLEADPSPNLPSSYYVAASSGFIISCAVVIGAIEAMHRARERASDATSSIERQKELLKTTLASIGDAVIVTDAAGKVVSLNREAERLTQWNSADAVGQPLPAVFRIVNENTRKPVEDPVEKVLRLGGVVGLANHTTLIGKDGAETPIDDSAAPIRQPGDQLSGVVLVFRDVTLQRRAQLASERLAAVIEHSGDVILSKDLQGLIQTWNPSAERLFGYRAEEIIGKPVTALFPPELLREEDDILTKLREGHHVERLETVRIAKDGRRIHVALSVSPLKNAEGEVIGASKIIHDISELVAAREALMREKELLSTTLKSIGDAVIVTDESARITFLNSEAEALTGWTSREAHGLALSKVFQIISERTREPVEHPVETVLRQGSPSRLASHTLLVSRDGREIPIDDSAAPIRKPDGTLFGVVLVFRDFTERRRAEQAMENHMQLAAAELASVTRLHQLGTRFARAENDFQECVAETLEVAISITGASKGTIQLRDSSGQLRIVAQQGFEEPFLKFFDEVFDETNSACETALHSGESLMIEDVTRSEFFAGTRALDVLLDAGVRAVRSTPLTDSAGKVVGMISTYFAQPHRLNERELRFMDLLSRQAADFVERKRAEEALRLAKENAETANKVKDRFLATLSHELRTPLTPILMIAGENARAPGLPEEIRRDFDTIHSNVTLEVRLIEDLLDLTRIERGKFRLAFTHCDLHALVRKVVEIARGEIARKQLQLRLELEASNPHVEADAVRLQQVIWNVVNNAVKFTPTGGSIVARTTNDSSGLQLAISDTGLGIKPENLDRIFAAFEQVEESANGTYGGLGLGLAISAGIMSAHHGRIWAESAGPGQGSTFRISLPVTALPEAPPAENANAGIPAQKPLRILLIEDHEDTRRSLGRILMRWGHKVTQAETCALARELAASTSYDVVVSDLGLPDGDGHALMRDLRDTFGIRGIALSGYGMSDDIQRSREAGFAAHLVKPIEIQALAEALEQFQTGER